ncbi:hypothetical protein HanRHA438_Chr16g0736341 [Helianthus annuus]|nr:hypothetical protein HanPI659440_Chr16g0619221 [Helianthus annuus]KAJ0833769.1 hypothetical protein HanRHA438_Chr16g0736341 [Helianthus annuus]
MLSFGTFGPYTEGLLDLDFGFTVDAFTSRFGPLVRSMTMSVVSSQKSFACINHLHFVHFV